MLIIGGVQIKKNNNDWDMSYHVAGMLALKLGNLLTATVEQPKIWPADQDLLAGKLSQELIHHPYSFLTIQYWNIAPF